MLPSTLTVTQTNADMISIFRMIIKNHSPFFSVLVYNCRFIATEKAPTAATDGRRVYYNPDFIQSLTNKERVAVFMHEILHIVYGHPYRRKLREPFRWNLACFEADAPVLTQNGYQPIASITPGTRVLTREGTYEPVAALLSKEYTGKLVTIKPCGSLEIKATEDHKFLTRRRLGRRCPVRLETEPQWRTAAELTTQDYILIPNNVEESLAVLPLKQFLSGERREIIKGDLPLDLETAWVLGRYLADGSACTDNSIQWSIGATKIQDVQRLVAWVESLGHYTTPQLEKSNVYKVGFNSVAFRKFTEHYFGRGARNKQVPTFMFGQSAAIIQSFIKGWQDGDGCPAANQYSKVFEGVNVGWTSSLNMALGLQRLGILSGQAVGISYREHWRKLPGATQKTHQTGYQVQFSPNKGSSIVMNGHVVTGSNKRAKQREDGLWVPITKIESHEFSGLVYTLNVHNSHTYTVWNMTVKNCDIYINQIIEQLSWCELPKSAVLEPDLWRETTEEIYELLKEHPEVEKKYKPQEITLSDLWEMPSEENGEAEPPGSNPGLGFKPATAQELAENEAKWKNLLERAEQEQVEKSSKFGSLPAQMQRTLDGLKVPQIDWRQALMQYLVSCPNDYDNFDRRFVADGFYTESLEGSTVRVDVCIDTSGSIGAAELGVFVAELVGIIQAYPQLCCDLYWADTEAYGPYNIEAIADIPQAEGGGGTCFRDFFVKMQAVEEKEVAKVAIYLTDGYGSFPQESPDGIDTLWVVTKDGLDLKQFPFGLAVKLTE